MSDVCIMYSHVFVFQLVFCIFISSTRRTRLIIQTANWEEAERLEDGQGDDEEGGGGGGGGGNEQGDDEERVGFKPRKL